MKNKKTFNFDQRSLRKDETILQKVRKAKKLYLTKAILFPGGFPMPFALFWGIIDIGFMVLAASTGGTWVLAFLIPFMGIHMAPVWIYIYQLVLELKSYNTSGYIITTHRIFYREGKSSQPFSTFILDQITDVQIASYKTEYCTVTVTAKDGKSLSINGLTSEDGDNVFRILKNIADQIMMREYAKQFKTKCENCGGIVKDGHCIYCLSPARRIKEIEDKTTKKKK